MRIPEHPPKAGHLGLRPARELMAEIWPEPGLRIRSERAELQHREDPPGAPDAAAAVENRRAGGDANRDRDRKQHAGAGTH